ncbi:MAG: hypothetical protein HRT68_11585 [Flavobacteriaceae bacterium]|nr:hypothetical protein [Flavobacteriaceae bacterium]
MSKYRQKVKVFSGDKQLKQMHHYFYDADYILKEFYLMYTAPKNVLAFGNTYKYNDSVRKVEEIKYGSKKTSVSGNFRL